jgi:hypothetical protein
MDVDAFSCNLGRIGSSYVPRASLTADTAIVAARVRFHTGAPGDRQEGEGESPLR